MLATSIVHRKGPGDVFNPVEKGQNAHPLRLNARCGPILSGVESVSKQSAPTRVTVDPCDKEREVMFENEQSPQTQPIHVPTRTDPQLAPKGKGILQALVGVLETLVSTVKLDENAFFEITPKTKPIPGWARLPTTLALYKTLYSILPWSPS